MSQPPDTPPERHTVAIGADEMQAGIRASRPLAAACPVPSQAGVPQATPVRPRNPLEENRYRSAGELMRRLADTVTQWRAQVSADSQPAILAILHGEVQINVTLLAEESYHGIRIEGLIDGNPCMLLAHQSSVQLLCYVARVEPEETPRKIGFIIDGETREV